MILNNRWIRCISVAAVFVSLTGFSNCTGSNPVKFIDKVAFSFSDNLEVFRSSLIFTDQVKADFSGAFSIKNYGSLFINPYSTTTPFEVGVDLNWVNIVNDQDYVNLQPTDVLPNGEPIGLNTLVQVTLDKPVDHRFDPYIYADVKNLNWLGLSVVINALTEKVFPEGLSVRDVIMKDENGNPVIFALAFGPTTNGDGSLKRAGGLALFANVRWLADHKKLKGEIKAGENAELIGPAASYFLSNPEALVNVQARVLEAINARN